MQVHLQNVQQVKLVCRCYRVKDKVTGAKKSKELNYNTHMRDVFSLTQGHGTGKMRKFDMECINAIYTFERVTLVSRAQEYLDNTVRRTVSLWQLICVFEALCTLLYYKAGCNDIDRVCRVCRRYGTRSSRKLAVSIHSCCSPPDDLSLRRVMFSVYKSCNSKRRCGQRSMTT